LSFFPHQLSHFYVREDHVLDKELPLWVPIPALAEMQVALEQAVGEVTGLAGFELKRVTSYGRNADRLVKAKRHYDPDHVFSSAIPLPASRPRLRRFQFALRASARSLQAP
jgi:nucleoside phosphorylase